MFFINIYSETISDPVTTKTTPDVYESTNIPEIALPIDPNRLRTVSKGHSSVIIVEFPEIKRTVPKHRKRIVSRIPRPAIIEDGDFEIPFDKFPNPALPEFSEFQQFPDFSEFPQFPEFPESNVRRIPYSGAIEEIQIDEDFVKQYKMHSQNFQNILLPFLSSIITEAAKAATDLDEMRKLKHGKKQIEKLDEAEVLIDY